MLENLLVNHKGKPGQTHWNWQGGKRHHCDGYIQIWNPTHHFTDCNGYVMEHRLVYEEFHKCCLLSWVDIHHINRIKDDNRPENLEGMTKGEHTTTHQRSIPPDRTCYICNSPKTYMRSTNAQWYRHHDGFLCQHCYRHTVWEKHGV